MDSFFFRSNQKTWLVHRSQEERSQSSETVATAQQWRHCATSVTSSFTKRRSRTSYGRVVSTRDTRRQVRFTTQILFNRDFLMIFLSRQKWRRILQSRPKLVNSLSLTSVNVTSPLKTKRYFPTLIFLSLHFFILLLICGFVVGGRGVCGQTPAASTRRVWWWRHCCKRLPLSNNPSQEILASILLLRCHVHCTSAIGYVVHLLIYCVSEKKPWTCKLGY